MLRHRLGRLSVSACAAAALALAAPGPAGTAGAAQEPGGRGTARGDAALRQAPARDSAVLTTASDGERVTVLCVAEGARRSAWYLVHTDHYAWASARDIAIAGRPPPWC
ncbi:SH3 domain-containing protein [Streptomyces marincola]|uniref:SH3 domain-containing protein n=1 Tax=Streptomyces marincola TaxID=2878388 RepID=UPI001CF18535|nr:SH3 domain-containing protein [Streptomyces marincola]UCM90369.1 SH3 domain-containing protein [Streptomyces marincola]